MFCICEKLKFLLIKLKSNLSVCIRVYMWYVCVILEKIILI